MTSDRRNFLKMSAGTISALMLPRILFAAAPSPIRLTVGEQLFIDDYLIASQNNLTRVIEPPPTRLSDPVVTAAEDKCFQPYVSVLRDPKAKRFRMWYNASTTPPESMRSVLGYMESEDGAKWIRPHRELADPGGTPFGFGASVVDEGTGCAAPGRRYKLAWDNNGLFTAFSPDGLKWTASSHKPVLGGIGDIVALSRDPIRKRYLLTCKVNSRPEDGYKGRTPNAKEGTRRLVGQSLSNDCITWSAPKRIIAADDRDEGVTEFYSIGQVIARGGLLIGLLKVLRDDLAHEPGGDKHGIGYTCLAWTRDGVTWERDREPFMDRNPTPGTWDRAMTWGDCLLQTDDEVFIYYGGYARGHKIERFKERQIGFARMKKDRFVARRAGAEVASLRTPVLTLDASSITINANVNGELRVRLVEPSGQAVEHFDFGDCVPIRGDRVAHNVRWKGNLATVRGPVCMEFAFSQASLYGLTLTA